MYLYNSIFQEKMQEEMLKLTDKRLLLEEMFSDIVTLEKYSELEMSDHLLQKYPTIKQCGTNITYDMDEGKISGADFCRWRLCPECAWRKSQKIYGQNIEVVRKIQKDENNNYGFIFVTLTIKNPKFNELSEAINHLNESWKRTMHRKEFRKISKGYYKTLEITYNQETDTWHPHFHILVCVLQSYFKSKNYISMDMWHKLWESSARLDYNSQIKVKGIGQDGQTLEGAVAEISKYSAKIAKVMQIKDEKKRIETMLMLHKTLHNRRLMTASGIFKDYLKKLKYDINSDNVLDESTTSKRSKNELYFVWSEGKYRTYEFNQKCTKR